VRLRLFLAAAALAAVCASSSRAQFTLRGSISGIVTDSSQAVVPGVSVTLTDLGRNQIFKTETNAAGLFVFTQLNIGRYQVSAERPGFKKAVSAPIDLVSGQSARVDLVLEVGAITEAVEVVASAPLLQTGQSLVGQTVEREVISALPAKGRNFTAYAMLAPNIYSFPSSGSGGGVSYLVAGGGDNGMYINGVYSNTTWGGTTGTVYSPSIEALSEVKVESANFSAAAGRDLSTYQAVIRGGTNQYHGALWESFENSVLRAWNPYTKMTLQPGAKKRVAQRNELGGNFGGPVWIPGLLKGRDRAFFFVNYERLFENTGAADAIYRVPTAAERQGDFSDLLRRFPGDANRVLWNPFSTTIDAKGNSNRLPVPNNDLRAVGIRPEAREILNMFPMPNGYTNPANPSDLRNYITFSAGGGRRYRLDSRFDYRITDNDNVYVNHSRHYYRSRNLGGLIPDLTGNSENWANLVTLNYARVFTPNLTNEFIFGWAYRESHPASLGVVDYLRRTDTLRNKFFKNIGTGIDKGFHRIAFSGGGWSSIGFNEIYINTQLITQFSDNVSYVRGAHSVKFGFNYLYANEHDWDYMRDVQFSSTMTRGGALNGRRGGDGLATFLLGVPTYILQPYKFPQGEEPRMDFSSVYWGFYVDDKWQLTPRTTLSIGIRNDLALPMYSPMCYGNVKMDFSYPGWQMLIPGRYKGLPQKFVPAPKGNFAPRLSVARQFGRDLVARLSYGIFYMAGSTVNGGSTVDYLMGGVPGYIGAEYFNAAFGVHDDIPYLKWDDIFPPQIESNLGWFPVSTAYGAGYFDYPKAVVAYDERSGRIPYYQRYMLELQKGFGPNTMVSLSYLGGRGTKLIYYENVNKPAYRTGWPSDDVYNAARPSPRFDDVRLIRAGRNSFYNALTARFERKMSNGLQLSAHYSFSKTVQDYGVPQAGWFGITNVDFGGYAEIVTSWDWNGHLARGEAPFSHPHRFVAAFNYELPWGRSWPRLLKGAFWGWALSGVATFENGNALTVWNGVTSARDGEPDVASILSGKPNLPRSERAFNRYFNKELFYAPPNDVKGNAGLGIVRAPGVNNWDLAIAKTFRPKERLRITLRADMFNAFNHIQWSGINTTFSDAKGNTFGWITGARDGRFAQFLLRVSF